MRSMLVLTAVLALSAACGQGGGSGSAAAAPAPMPAAQPEGRWNVALVAQGQTLDFVLELRRISGDEFGGVVTNPDFPPMNVNKATLTGNRMKMSVTAPTGDEATFDIVFEGDVFTGDWAMPGDGSKVSGRRIP
jgi:hypothetical protein